MPKATVSTVGERHDLTSLPGGYVILKAMSYSERKTAQDQAAYSVQKRGNTDEARTNFTLQLSRQIEFAACIVDHNLWAGDTEDTKLDFNKRSALNQLDPKVGEEIEKLIDKLHGDDVDEELFPKPATELSQDVM